jgi:hypothetical protein
MSAGTMFAGQGPGPVAVVNQRFVGVVPTMARG